MSYCLYDRVQAKQNRVLYFFRKSEAKFENASYQPWSFGNLDFSVGKSEKSGIFRKSETLKLVDTDN